MKNTDISKLEKLAMELKEIGSDFPHKERMKWAIENDMHLETVNRYMRGEASSIPIAEMLLIVARKYKKVAA